MKIMVFDTHKFERNIFETVNKEFGFDLKFLDTRLTVDTVPLVEDFSVVCSFVNDKLDANVLKELKIKGVELIALRSAGFNHIDMKEATRLGLKVTRVPSYSPNAVAEHAVCLVLALNRKIHRAYSRVREHNFSLDGMVGFDLHGKTVGVIGTGRIGAVFARIMNGFGCKVLANDVQTSTDLANFVEYVPLDTLLKTSDIISLHVPLTAGTRHLINHETLAKTKRGIMIINTGRGALIETKALIENLKNGHIGSAGLDVYEEEENVFFQDLSEAVLQDDVLARLLTFSNVLVTSHQAFLTKEALENIARTTLESVRSFQRDQALINLVPSVA